MRSAALKKNKQLVSSLQDKHHSSCLAPHFINDGLHVALVFVIPIELGGPLFRTDAQPRLHSHADDLPIMLTPQALVGAKLKERHGMGTVKHQQATHLFLELHER